MYSVKEFRDIKPKFFYSNGRIIFKNNYDIIIVKDDQSRFGIPMQEKFALEYVDHKTLFYRTSSAFKGLNLKDLTESFGFQFEGLKQIKLIKPPNFIVNERIQDDWILSCFTFSGELYWTHRYSGISELKFISLNRILILDDVTLYSINTKAKSEVWHKDLSELLKTDEIYISGQVYEWNEKIYLMVKCKNRSSGGLFCLDAKTGHLIKHFEGDFYSLFADGVFLYTSRFENILTKIKLHNNSVIEWGVDLMIKNHGFKTINDHRCLAKSEKFYFTQTFGEGYSMLGVLDTISNEILFKYKFDTNNGAIGNIRLADDKILIHTQDNTLHIFNEDNLIV